jgi:TolA-binding protein
MEVKAKLEPAAGDPLVVPPRARIVRPPDRPQFVDQTQRVRELEQRIAELERKIKELEKK